MREKSLHFLIQLALALVWAALTTVFCSMVIGAAPVAQVVQAAGAAFLGADLLALLSLALRALALAYLILILLR